MRLIDADALWMDIIHSMDYCDDILEIIENTPTVQPERKKGEWVQDWIAERVDVWLCSECMQPLQLREPYTDRKIKTNYCPNCGADMRGTDE